MERRKVGSNDSLAKQRSTVSTSVEVVRSAINDRDLKWRSMVNEKVEIGRIRVAKSHINIRISTMADRCPKGFWRGILCQN